jgi:hypothetical protein
MDSLTASAALQLPVRLQGITLGRPIDLLVATETWQVLGFVVRCRDESERFLPYAASQPSSTQLAIGSALLLLEDADFYRRRGASLRDLVGAAVEHDGRPAGLLRDLVLGQHGEVSELLVEDGGAFVRLRAPGCRVASPRASAA